MLEMVKMPKPKSCSVCCVAMLAHKSFNETMQLCFEQEPKDFSMDFDAMENALQKSDLETTRLESFPQNPRKNLLIECRNEQRGYWHYIVYDAAQKAFLDPIPNPPKLEEYKFYRAIAVE